MRKTLIALALGLTALVAAACGGTGSTPSSGVDTAPSVAAPSDAAAPSDMLESPSTEPAAS